MIHRLRTTLATAAACGLLFSAAAATSAVAAPKDYQFTGPIAAMDDTSFSVMKGKETWEFAKDGETKLPEGAKVGDKVTVHYVMHATTVEASAAKAPAGKEKAPKGAKKADDAKVKPVGSAKGNDKAADATAPAAPAATPAP